MIYKYLFLFLVSGTSTVLCSNFDDTKINFDSLVNVADAVVLENNLVIKISDGEYGYNFHKKILIKNKRADDYCTVVLSQSNYIKIDDVEAVLLDTLGNEIKELDSDDIREMEISPGSVFYSGDLYKIFELKHYTYPFVFEYRYHVEISSLFFWPDWDPQSSIPVLSASCEVIDESDTKFKFFTIGIDVEKSEKKSSEGISYFWQLKNIPQFKNEDYLPPENHIQKAILFAPESFEIDGYTGSFENWKKLGQWSFSLFNGKFDLPEKAKTEILEKVSGAIDAKEKIKILYKYMQSRSRYVAIEMGINGWMPQPAASVYENKYGDCKDLSTFMVAVLRTAGINAYPALALTRRKGKVYTDFPSNQFNHCIVFVPLEKDTIWLECTDPYLEMEDTPGSIEDTEALVIKPDGGELIHTPQKKSSENVWKGKLEGILSKTGDLNFSASVQLTGNQKNYFKEELAENSNKDDLIFLQGYFGRNCPTLNLTEFSEVFDPTHSSDYELNIMGTYEKFIVVKSSRLFVNPNIFNKETDDDLPEQKPFERKYPVYNSYPFTDIDSVFIKIPTGCSLESMPKEKEIIKPFAKYSSSYNFQDGKIVFVRKMERFSNLIPVEQYPEFYDFMKEVIKADEAKYIFKMEK